MSRGGTNLPYVSSSSYSRVSQFLHEYALTGRQLSSRMLSRDLTASLWVSCRTFPPHSIQMRHSLDLPCCLGWWGICSNFCLDERTEPRRSNPTSVTGSLCVVVVCVVIGLLWAIDNEEVYLGSGMAGFLSQVVHSAQPQLPTFSPSVNIQVGEALLLSIKGLCGVYWCK